MSEAGRRGDRVRSDCWIRFSPGGSEVRIDIQSKVAALYGKKIREQIAAGLNHLGITAGQVEVEDQGALPYVIAARLETAIRRSGASFQGFLIPEGDLRPSEESDKERLRRSRLYIPGNMPHYFINAGLYKPDGIILDLEDSVAPAEKDAARPLVRNALMAVDFMSAEQMVRINQLPEGLEDLKWIVPYGVQLILIPKCESAEQVRQVDQAVRELAPDRSVWLMPIIESALGCFKALEIATASNRVAALTIGLEDYTADLGIQRTRHGLETLWALQTVINAAKAAGVQAIDTVFADVADMEGLKESVAHAKSLGFEGKGCIHPKQIEVVHEGFAPGQNEIDQAIQIVLAYENAGSKGLGVTVLGSKMIDAPVVKRALKLVRQAESLGLLTEDWRGQRSPSDIESA